MNHYQQVAMPLLFGGMCVFATVYAGTSVDASKVRADARISDFSANYRLTHIASDTLMESVHLQVSAHGLVIRQQMPSATGAVVFNASRDKLWWIDNQRRVVHAIPITSVQTDSEELAGSAEYSSSDTDGLITSDHHSVASIAPFLQFEPCLNMESVLTSELVVNGAKQQLWECSFEGAVVEEQWYDVDHALVVSSVSADGYRAELNTITPVQYSEEHFLPPADYRAVSINEFMRGAEPIEQYNEQKDGDAGKDGSTISMNGFANQNVDEQLLP